MKRGTRQRESWLWRWGRVGAAAIAAVVGWSIAAPSAAWDDSVKPAAPPAMAIPAVGVSGLPLATLDEAVVIGASVSDGFGTLVTPPAGPTGTPDRAVMVKLADVLAAIVGRDEPLASSTSSFFFQRPRETAEEQLAFAKARSPKLVFAIDYLFWHAYGFMDELDRPKALERGIARLEQLGDVPIVICDLPDMSHAVGLMLGTRQVPHKDTLAKLNARISEWAQGRKNVIVLPMTGVVADAMANKGLTLGGREYPAGQSRGLLTGDGLHATGDGEIAVGIEAMDRLIRAGVLHKDVPVERDPAAVKARLVKMKAPNAPGGTNPPAGATTPAAPGSPAPK